MKEKKMQLIVFYVAKVEALENAKFLGWKDGTERGQINTFEELNWTIRKAETNELRKIFRDKYVENTVLVTIYWQWLIRKINSIWYMGESQCVQT